MLEVGRRSKTGPGCGHGCVGRMNCDRWSVSDQLSVDQNPIRVGQCRAGDDGVIRAVHRDVDEVDRPFLLIHRAIGKAQAHLDVLSRRRGRSSAPAAVRAG
jgi:hypothetical protein